MQESSKVKMIERVTVMKFDKTKEDDPQEPCEVICQETTTEVDAGEAALLGFKPKGPEVDATATVKLGDQ
jgi:hypothetical protein